MLIKVEISMESAPPHQKKKGNIGRVQVIITKISLRIWQESNHVHIVSIFM